MFVQHLPAVPLIATGSDDIRVIVHRDGEPPQVLKGHRDSVPGLSFCPTNPDLLASASYDKSVIVWDLGSNSKIKTLQCRDSLYSVSWSCDGQYLAAACADQKCYIFDAHNDYKQLCVLEHTDFVESVDFHPYNSTVCATASGDETVRVWQLSSGSQKPECLKVLSHGGAIWGCSWLPDGQHLVSGCDDCAVRLWNVEDGTEVAKFEGHSHAVLFVAASPDGRMIASGSQDKSCRIWEVNSGTVLQVLQHPDYVRAVAFSGNGHVVTGCNDEKIRVWSIAVGKVVAELGGHGSCVSSVAVPPAGAGAAAAASSSQPTSKAAAAAQQQVNAATGCQQCAQKDAENTQLKQQQQQKDAENLRLKQEQQRLEQEQQQKDAELAQLKQQQQQKDAENAQLKAVLAQRDAELAQRDAELAQHLARIADLKKQLQNNSKPTSPFANGKWWQLDLAALGHSQLELGKRAPLQPNNPFFDFVRNDLWKRAGTMFPSPQPVAGFELAGIDVINPNFINSFEDRMKRLQLLRQSGSDMFNPATSKFNAEQLQVLIALRDQFLSRVPGAPAAAPNCLFVFHGTKMSLLDSVVNGIVAVRSTDAGFFGAGCYTTPSIEYAAKYACGMYDGSSPATRDDGAVPVVMCCAAVGVCYPVTTDDVDGSKGAGHTKFFGGPLQSGFDCHCAPISERNGCRVVPRDQMQYMELVLDQEVQVLPIAVLWVKL